MSILVVAEHDNRTLKPVTLNVLAAAAAIGGDVDVLVAGSGSDAVAKAASQAKGVRKALHADNACYAHQLAENLAALVANVNRLVYEASSANRYATFFYGQYNPASRQLTYVNAGHNPPMLFHHSQGQWSVSRLEVGGTVVGLLESFPYQQATLTIAPGDIFIAFTDGISEAMNGADEEWGEAQLMETIKRCAGLRPAEIIPRIMQAADTFVAGAKQHDDMTLVVLRSL